MYICRFKNDDEKVIYYKTTKTNKPHTTYIHTNGKKDETYRLQVLSFLFVAIFKDRKILN